MVPTRTTLSSMTWLLTRNSAKLTEQMRTLETQVLTGSKFSRPSDDPWGVSESLRLDGLIKDQDSFQTNAGTATSILDTADGALGELADLIKGALELAVQGSSEGYDATARASIAVEIEGIRENVLSVINTRVGDRYIFSGEAYDTPPYDETGTYAGGTTQPEIQVAVDTWAALGLDGSQVMQSDIDGFQVLADFQTALETDDIGTIQNSLDDLQVLHDQLVEWRQRVGHETQVVMDAEVMAENLEVTLGEALDARAGIDEAEVYAKLAELRTVYQAAMQVGSTSMSGKLFDFV